MHPAVASHLSNRDERNPGERRLALLAACGLAFVLGACGGGDAAAARVEFPAARTESAVQVGGADTANPDATIGTILAARFTGSGEHVVVLDFAPPYVKVFRRDVTLDTAFLGRGGGPREIRHPTALAVAGDSLILVVDGARRVAAFGMEGQQLAKGRTGFPVLTGYAGCDGEWVAYGPASQRAGQPSWLHRLQFDSGRIQVQDLDFREALGAGTVGYGLAYGMARRGDTVRVWHVLGAEPAVLGWACGQPRAHAWPVHPLAQRGSEERRGAAVRMSIEPGQRMLAGMAAVPGGVLLAAHVFPAPGEPATTELTLVTANGEQTVAVTGDYTVRDSHPRLGVLVSTTDPAPRLFTISTEDLQRLFDSPR
jgi:hypothetical protein